MKIWRIAFAMLATFSLASCSSDDDNDKDITKVITMSVSAEPGIMYDLFDSMREYPIKCMRVMTEDEPGRWQNLYFGGIKGFTYERGHEYELLVKRTILANPPQDASNRTYELVRILADKKVEEVAEPHSYSSANNLLIIRQLGVLAEHSFIHILHAVNFPTKRRTPEEASRMT